MGIFHYKKKMLRELLCHIEMFTFIGLGTLKVISCTAIPLHLAPKQSTADLVFCLMNDPSSRFLHDRW